MYADAHANNTDTHTDGNSGCYSHSYTHGNSKCYADGDAYAHRNTNTHRYSQGNTKKKDLRLEAISEIRAAVATVLCRCAAMSNKHRRRLDAARRLQSLHRGRLRDPLPWKVLTDLCTFG